MVEDYSSSRVSQAPSFGSAWLLKGGDSAFSGENALKNSPLIFAAHDFRAHGVSTCLTFGKFSSSASTLETRKISSS